MKKIIKYSFFLLLTGLIIFNTTYILFNIYLSYNEDRVKAKNIIKKIVRPTPSIDNLELDNIEMIAWILENDTQGWKSINWKDYTPAIINYKNYKNTLTNEKGEEIANLLNLAYIKPYTDNEDPNLADYVDRGFFVHAHDSLYDKDRSLFHPTQEIIATTYLQAQLDLNNSTPIYYDTFHEYSPGEASPIVIYYPLNYLSVKDKYLPFSVHPSDAATIFRYLGADMHFNSSISYKEEIDKAWSENKSINTAKLAEVDTFEKYLKILVQNSAMTPSFSSNQEDFNTFINYRRNLVLLNKIQDARKINKVSSYNLDSKRFGLFKLYWNEVVLRIPQESDYFNMIAAIGYLTSDIDPYYEAPEGYIKSYNIHLQEAQVQQKNIWEEEGVFKPILEVKVDNMSKGIAPLLYHPEDQVVSLD